MSAPVGPRPRRWPRRLLALLLATAFGLALLEVALRIVDPLQSPIEHLRGFYRLDAQHRVETTPGWRGSTVVDGRTTAIELNALGLRGPELAAKAPRERRVLLLGDSFTFGMGVEAGEAIPAALERLLAARGQRATVGNGGMWGTGPREWSYTLQRHRPGFQPDLAVALCYLGNDLLDSLQPPLSVLDGHLLTSSFAHGMRASWRWNLALRFRTWWHLERLLTGDPRRQVPAFAIALPPGIDVHEGIFMDLREEHADTAPWLGGVLAVLRGHFAAFAAATDGLPVLVVLLPPYEEIASGRFAFQLQRMGLDAARYRRGAGANRMAALLGELGLPCLDVSERFFAHPDPDSLCLKDRHYNAAGCAQVAEWIAPEVAGRLR